MRTPSPQREESAPSPTVHDHASASSSSSAPQPDAVRLLPPFSEERVYGHAPVPGQEHHPVAQAMRDVMAQEKTRRRTAKAALAGELYHERAAFAPGLRRGALKKQPGGPEFFNRFDQGGHYQQRWDALQVTKGSVSTTLQRTLHGTEWGEGTTFEPGDRAHETKVVHKGQHVYTLYRGASAWMAPDEAASSSSGSSSVALARRIFRKHGGGDKEYVHDDANVPTRRYAYAVKDPRQVEALAGGALRGRYLLDERPRGPGPLGVDIMHGTPDEQAMLNKPGVRDLTEDEMLAIHLEFGSGKRQRGVSASSTPAPLLSNEARGFAQEHHDARKLRIDLATIPARASAGAAPNLRNFHQRIPGHEDARVRLADWHSVSGSPPLPGDVAHPAAHGQEHFEWSAAKNRELFIRELNPGNVAGTDTPSPLETMGYIDLAGPRVPSADLASEYERVRRRGDYSTPLPPSVHIGAPASSSSTKPL